MQEQRDLQRHVRPPLQAPLSGGTHYLELLHELVVGTAKTVRAGFEKAKRLLFIEY